MGRPSKLDDRQWAEIGRRIAMGEGVTALAKEFKVSKTVISERFSKRKETIKTLANTLATVEVEIEALPVNEQCSVRTMADQLKSISDRLATAANHGAFVASRMAEIAAHQAKSLKNDAEPDAMRPVVAAMETANKASTIGMGLLAANKGKEEQGASIVVKTAKGDESL